MRGVAEVGGGEGEESYRGSGPGVGRANFPNEYFVSLLLCDVENGIASKRMGPCSFVVNDGFTLGSNMSCTLGVSGKECGSEDWPGDEGMRSGARESNGSKV